MRFLRFRSGSHLVPLAGHVLHGAPPPGVGVEALRGAELQPELVPPPRHVDLAQVGGAARPLPGTPHGGAWGPGPLLGAVALHWGRRGTWENKRQNGRHLHSACLTSGHSKSVTTPPDIHPFMHTFTQRRRGEPRQ